MAGLDLERFAKIYIDEGSRESELARRVCSVAPTSMIEWVDGNPLKNTGALTAEQFENSKKNIFITEFKGQFFKRCPGARPGLLCCNYFVLNLGQQCDMNCSYCYLQSFINSPLLTIYSNLPRALQELDEMGTTLADQKVRIGTGEVIDSLSLDDLTLSSRTLIEFFRKYPAWTLEFKSKSDKVDQFLDCDHAGNVIVSWSINPQYIIEREEHGTASLEQRIAAAKKCLRAGFQIAFHIDPMIWHVDWKDSYALLVDRLCEEFRPDQIPYFSVGALRFQPEQRHIMRERFGLKSLVTSGEMFVSSDGKLRYDQTLRQEMFDFVLKRFRDNSSDWKIFLCMETPETWTGASAGSPRQSAALANLFDRKVLQAFRTERL